MSRKSYIPPSMQILRLQDISLLQVKSLDNEELDFNPDEFDDEDKDLWPEILFPRTSLPALLAVCTRFPGSLYQRNGTLSHLLQTMMLSLTGFCVEFDGLLCWVWWAFMVKYPIEVDTKASRTRYKSQLNSI